MRNKRRKKNKCLEYACQLHDVHFQKAVNIFVVGHQDEGMAIYL